MLTFKESLIYTHTHTQLLDKAPSESARVKHVMAETQKSINAMTAKYLKGGMVESEGGTEQRAAGQFRWTLLVRTHSQLQLQAQGQRACHA